MTLPAGYFDQMYAETEDPWGFSSRWYERRKYALELAALPDPEYGTALEIGCSVGVLTAELASRCGTLVAVDSSAAALATARRRVPASVQLVQGGVPDDWPSGRYDLVVLSEVGYYLDAPDLERLLALVERDLAPGGTVLACHWRHPVTDYPSTGDQVHAALARWPRLSRIEEEDFLLDVLVPGGVISVARREGLQSRRYGGPGASGRSGGRARSQRAAAGGGLPGFCPGDSEPSGPARIEVHVVPVLDACDDDSGAFAPGAIEVRARNVGVARAAGFAAVLAREAGRWPDQVWLATTDAYHPTAIIIY